MAPDVATPAAPGLDAALEHLARGVAIGAELTVVGIRLLSHRIPVTIQVLVQRADGLDVSLDQCASISAPLGEALEASGLISFAYVLEVSSPGIGEDLASDRDFTSFRGFPVEVLRHSEGAEQVREGLLLGRDESMLLLNVRGRTVRIPRDEVLRVRLICPTDDS
jgi:ribosome maturation factor RimP